MRKPVLTARLLHARYCSHFYSAMRPLGRTKDAVIYWIDASCFPKTDSGFRADAVECDICPWARINPARV